MAAADTHAQLDASDHVSLARARGAPRALLFSCVASDVRTRLKGLPEQAALEAILDDALAGRPTGLAWVTAPFRFPASAEVDRDAVRAVGSVAEASGGPCALDVGWLLPLSSGVRFRPASVLGACLATSFEPREEPRGESLAARWDALSLDEVGDADLLQRLWAHGTVHDLDSPVPELRSVLHAWWLETGVSNGGCSQLLFNRPAFDLVAGSDGLARIGLADAAALALEVAARGIRDCDDDRYYAARDLHAFERHIAEYVRGLSAEPANGN